MSRNGYRDTTSKLTRSNSHDSISLNPISKFVHSTPTSHGADQRTFGAKDDSSSHEYIVSSPYENASSAIAVSSILDHFFSSNTYHLPRIHYHRYLTYSLELL